MAINSIILSLVVGFFTTHTDSVVNGGFSKDQRGKFVLFGESKLEVSFSEAELKDAVSDFFKDQGATVSVMAEGQLKISGKKKLKKNAEIGNYVAGYIYYTAILENKDGMLQYWFTDLTYQPYVIGRYGTLVPASVKPMPLEENLSVLNQRSWERQRKNAYQTLQTLSSELKAELQQEGKPEPAVINTPIATSK